MIFTKAKLAQGESIGIMLIIRFRDKFLYKDSMFFNATKTLVLVLLNYPANVVDRKYLD